MRQHTNDIFRRNLSARLLAMRGDRSQAEFARFLELPSQQTYQRYEDGAVLPPYDVLHMIATRLKVPVEFLVNGEDEPMAIKNIPRPLPTEMDCTRYLALFLQTCEGNTERLGWTLVVLKESLPLDRWKKKP